MVFLFLKTVTLYVCKRKFAFTFLFFVILIQCTYMTEASGEISWSNKNVFIIYINTITQALRLWLINFIYAYVYTIIFMNVLIHNMNVLIYNYLGSYRSSRFHFRFNQKPQTFRINCICINEALGYENILIYYYNFMLWC